MPFDIGDPIEVNVVTVEDVIYSEWLPATVVVAGENNVVVQFANHTRRNIPIGPRTRKPRIRRVC